MSFAVQNENLNLWRIPLSSSGVPAAEPSQLLASTRKDEGPAFSRDGRMLSFFSDRTGSYEIWTSEASGNSPRALTSFGGAFLGLTDWSPDGETILFDVVTANGQNIYSVASAGGKPQPVITGPARDAAPIFHRMAARYISVPTAPASFKSGAPIAMGAIPLRSRKAAALDRKKPTDTSTMRIKPVGPTFAGFRWQAAMRKRSLRIPGPDSSVIGQFTGAGSILSVSPATR